MSVSSTFGIASAPRVPPRSEGSAVTEVKRQEKPAPSETEVQAKASPPAIQASNTTLTIERDEATDRYVFRTVDKSTGEVIRQYPTEQMLSLFARARRLTGLTIDTGA